uniref:Uncharacterized protein n=1 Tax=Sphaerodactylus townsendi TaxID=933632 RepID=A0ACB8FXE1_9SAUR
MSSLSLSCYANLVLAGISLQDQEICLFSVHVFVVLSIPDADAKAKFDETSLSEGSTVDLAIPSDLLEQMPELAEEMMEPEDCFPEHVLKL